MTPAPLPAVELLRPAPWKRLALLAVSLALVGLAVAIGGRQPAVAWGLGGIFGACTLVALAGLLPGAHHLRLDANGLELRALFRTTHLAWSDIARFGTTRVGLHPVVGLDFAPHVDHGARLRRVNRGLSGFHGALPDTYGLGADALAARLQQWHRAYAPASKD
ncbi:PH domain-containing protein [Luteimonas sp. S4-F44]|uniref:PH domain-containing protein n=1 Tax=Luteimonas sp. S4-F44 TaxID=2925842 RepID=UPI001F53C253|nr:PH domain-containing protein [Luteimonas sp. S4-F44]UNK42808.1 PH domain-containing protein [Luteimonas sp. S4-F44]